MDGSERSATTGKGGPRRAEAGGFRPQVIVAILVAFVAFAGFAYWSSERQGQSSGDRDVEECSESGVGYMAISIDRPFPDPEPAVRAVRQAVESDRSPLDWTPLPAEPDRRRWVGRDGEGELVVVAEVVRGEGGWGPGVTRLCV